MAFVAPSPPLLRPRPRALRQPRRRPRRAPPVALLNPQVAVVLSHHEAAALLSLRTVANSLPPGALSTTASGTWSADLGRTTLTSIIVAADGLVLVGRGQEPPPGHEPALSDADVCDDGAGQRAPLGVQVTFGELKKMSKKGKVGAYDVYLDGVSAPDRIAGISDLTSRTASLQPHVAGAPPTVTLGGFGMHRFSGTDPGLDTAAKIAALERACGGAARGKALDICTGLGYTAIGLAACPGVGRVVTIELDPVIADDVSRRNPWSEELFVSAKIERVVGDACQVVAAMEGGAFDVVVHDPPAQAMGGELYAGKFYDELCRVMKAGGCLFHYVGDPGSVESGRLFRGVRARLIAAGFENVCVAEEAFGVTATVKRR
jgi:predicted methyltransferase